MIDCLIIGDSIAKGVSDVRVDCSAYAVSGINSKDWNRRFGNKDLTARVLVISLGSNDLAGVNTREELEYIRRCARDSDRVLWILPAIKPNIQKIVLQVADNYGDDVLELLELSDDGVHPTGRGYRSIAKQF